LKILFREYEELHRKAALPINKAMIINEDIFIQSILTRHATLRIIKTLQYFYYLLGSSQKKYDNKKFSNNKNNS
jgi:hypothetical protein